MLGALAILILGCGRLSEPPPLLSEAEGTLGRQAFFSALLKADYDQVDNSIELLTREYLEGDVLSTATLGFAHAWRLGEAGRVEDGSARVIESADLAVRFFTEASEDLPDDPRIVGFLGSFKQAQGAIHGRPELQTEGWFDQGKAVRAWPEWGLFARAYGLVTMNPEERRYKEGIELLWQNLEECIDDSIDRDDFDYRRHFDDVQHDQNQLNARACGNSAVVPYNAQGFFLVFGDMLAKAGELEMAKDMYNTSMGLPGSETWPYQWLVEHRIDDLSQLPSWFSEAPDRSTQANPTRTTTFSGPYNCAVCHAIEDSTLEYLDFR